MDKKLEKILILLLILLVVLLLISNIIFNKDKKEVQKNSYVDEKIESNNNDVNVKYDSQIETNYSNIMENKEKEAISRVIDTIIQQINNKDYKLIYDKLSEPVKTNIYPTFDIFESEMTRRTENYIYDSDGYIANFYGYECLFYPKDVYDVNAESNINMIIKLTDDSKDYKIILNRLIEYKNMLSFDVVEQMTIEFEKELRYVDKTGYMMSFKNNSNSEITIYFNDVYVVLIRNGSEEQTYSKSVKPLVLKPKETKKIEFTFSEYSYLTLKPSSLIVNMRVKDKNINCEFFLENENYIELNGGM